MRQQTLYSAFTAALRSANRNQLASTNPTPQLVNALMNSTTHMDQIVQRRIGLITSSPRVL